MIDSNFTVHVKLRRLIDMTLKDHKESVGNGAVPPSDGAENVSKDALFRENKRLLAELNKARAEAKVLQDRLSRANQVNREYEALFAPVSTHKLIADCDEQTVARMTQAGWEPVHMASAARAGYIHSAFPARVEPALSPVVVSVMFKRDEAPSPTGIKETVEVEAEESTPSPMPIPEEVED